MPVLTKINTNVIAEDAITGDKFAGDAYLSNTSNQNISGTYSENRLYTSDAYTLSGNATINSNVILSSVKPNSDIVLTADGARTITGTGVLSGGDMYGRNTVTGMSGVLESTVTGSPNLNLGSATLPTGSVIQVVSTTKRDKFSKAGADYFEIPGLSATIGPTSVSNKILVTVHIGKVTAQIADGQTTAIQIRRGTTAIGGGTTSGSQTSVNAFINSGSTNANYAGNNMSCQFLDSPNTTSDTTYSVYITGADGGNFSVIINANINLSTGSAAYEDAASSTITLMEIAG